MAKAVIECPHCKQECTRTPLTRISPDRDPSVRKKVQDLSLFRWKCPNCGTTIEKDFIVCPVCNTQVRNVCPTCKRPLEAHWKVCPFCRTHIQ